LHDADEYMKRLANRLAFLLEGNKIDTYEPVGIAILDSGIDAKHPISLSVRGYMDFMSETDNHLDMTGHGTNGVLATIAVAPDANVFVARVFEEEPTHPNTPSVVARVCSSWSCVLYGSLN
jgi:subtilisin family serine protease